MNMNYEELEEKGFNYAQINQIIKAEKNNLDLSNLGPNTSVEVMRKIIEINPDIEAKKMPLLVKCLKNNFDISYVLDNKYNYKQAAQIIDGMYKRINYELYADPKYTSNNMKDIKKGLINGMDERIVGCPDFTPKNIRGYVELVTSAKGWGFDIFKYAKMGYKLAQMEIMLDAHKCRMEIENFITPEFNCDQIKAVMQCITKNCSRNVNIDISKIAKPNHSKTIIHILYELAYKGENIDPLVDKNYTKAQLNLVRMGMLKNLDYKMYSDPRFSSKQMSAILNGLELGLDVSCYADLKYSDTQMIAFYTILKSNQQDPKNEIDINLLLHKEYDQIKILKYAKNLRAGTLDEKLAVMIEHNKLSDNERQNNIENNRYDR